MSFVLNQKRRERVEERFLPGVKGWVQLFQVLTGGCLPFRPADRRMEMSGGGCTVGGHAKHPEHSADSLKGLANHREFIHGAQKHRWRNGVDILVHDVKRQSALVYRRRTVVS